MHLADGILSPPVLVGSFAVAAAGTAIGLRRMRDEDVPRTAVMSAVFFVGGLVHIDVGPGSVHLLLTGLVGVMLGWGAFPALLVALLLQAVFFGHGGLSVLGANVVIQGLPAVVFGLGVRQLLVRTRRPVAVFLLGATTGAGAILMACSLAAMALALSSRAFLTTAATLAVAHLPLLAIEGVVVGAAVSFLHTVRPDLLGVVGTVNVPATESVLAAEQS